MGQVFEWQASAMLHLGGTVSLKYANFSSNSFFEKPTFKYAYPLDVHFILEKLPFAPDNINVPFLSLSALYHPPQQIDNKN